MTTQEAIKAAVRAALDLPANHPRKLAAKAAVLAALERRNGN